MVARCSTHTLCTDTLWGLHPSCNTIPICCTTMPYFPHAVLVVHVCLFIPNGGRFVRSVFVYLKNVYKNTDHMNFSRSHLKEAWLSDLKIVACRWFKGSVHPSLLVYLLEMVVWTKIRIVCLKNLWRKKVFVLVCFSYFRNPCTLCQIWGHRRPQNINILLPVI